MIQLRNRDQIIENSGKQVLATLVASFLEKQERIIRENRFHRNKSYTNLIPASRNGVGIKSIQPVFNLALRSEEHTADWGSEVCSSALRARLNTG